MFPNSVFKWEAKFATAHKTQGRDKAFTGFYCGHRCDENVVISSSAFLSWLYWAAKLEMRSQKREKPARNIIYVNGSFGVIA